uniref:Nuclease EXOG, mitochondrial n=1 Tax=Vombatus ursinus TaxID=29139 RepID=A0A4X2KD78_VOMUR
ELERFFSHGVSKIVRTLPCCGCACEDAALGAPLTALLPTTDRPLSGQGLCWVASPSGHRDFRACMKPHIATAQRETLATSNADRRHCKFCPDPSIPPAFSADNEDYLGSGWSRGHMAPAGNNKFSTEAMQETFYLSNIVPQNFDNNAGYWNRIEMYCRELTERFDDVWIVSGPLTLPQMGEDGRKRVTYEVIGKDDVAVPSHLYKVILARRSLTSSEPLALGAFVVPNDAIGFRPQLTEFQVSIRDLEKMAGIVFFPRLDTARDTRSLCEVDTCKLLDFQEFTLYLSKRKIQGARTAHRLEKVMSELKEAGVQADEHLLSLYREKLRQLSSVEPPGVQERKPS